MDEFVVTCSEWTVDDKPNCEYVVRSNAVAMEAKFPGDGKFCPFKYECTISMHRIIPPPPKEENNTLPWLQNIFAP